MFGQVPSKRLTTEERYNVRMAFVNLGFVRTGATRDNGEGVYSETWALGKNEIVITWEEKNVAEYTPEYHFKSYMAMGIADDNKKLTPRSDIPPMYRDEYMRGYNKSVRDAARAGTQHGQRPT